MIVCHCRRINDRRISEAIAQGASTVTEVSERCGAGSSCGGCLPTVENLLQCSNLMARAVETEVRATIRRGWRRVAA